MRCGFLLWTSSVGGLLSLLGCGQKAVGPGFDMLTPITVTPSSATIAVGQTAKFTAIATDVTAPVRFTWSSSDARVATVDSLGDATGVSPGTAYIEATAGAVAGQSVINVTAASTAVAPRFVKSKVQRARSSLNPSSAP